MFSTLHILSHFVFKEVYKSHRLLRTTGQFQYLSLIQLSRYVSWIWHFNATFKCVHVIQNHCRSLISSLNLRYEKEIYTTGNIDNDKHNIQ